MFNSNNWQALMSLQLMDCRKLTDKNIKSITKDCYSLINLTIANGINLTNIFYRCSDKRVSCNQICKCTS